MRKNISKKARFEVFKRDSFKCQYCGESAPDVILHVDHINPVAKGGDNAITNLITSCQGCNLGKGARELSDSSAVGKQKKQLEELNERRQQLEMMMEWRKGLLELDNDKLEYVIRRFSEVTGFSPNEKGRETLRKLTKKFSFDLVTESLEASLNQYLELDPSGGYSHESSSKAFDMIGRICSVKRRQENNPGLAEVAYAKGILRNRFKGWSPASIAEFGRHMERVVMKGGDPSVAKDIAIRARNYADLHELLTHWEQDIDE